MQSFLPNPYIPDRPARDPEKFFGRDESLSWIAARLQPHALVVIHGPPRIGISSLLLQACQALSDTHQSTYILLDTQSPYAAMQQVARVVSTAVGLPQTDSPQTLREALDDSIHDRQCKPVLVALDGLAGWELRAKTDLINSLALLSSANAQIRFLLGWGILEDTSITREMPLRLIGLTDNLAPIAQLRLGPLTRVQASQLITETAGSLLKYDFNAVERIVQAANGRPYALQLLGFACYERRALMGRVGARDVEQAIDDAIARESYWMNEQWESFTRAEQLLLAAAATVRGEHGLFSINKLTQELFSHHIELSADEAREALAHLEQLDIFEPAGVQSFRFSFGLLRDWAVQFANLQALTGERPRSVLLDAVALTPRRRARLMRILGWSFLIVFVAFIAMGGPSLAGIGVSAPPPLTSTPTAQLTPTRVLSALATPTPKIVIAYMNRKTDKDKWRIYVAGQDGTNPTPLTSGLSDDQWPSWSPDGSKIVFTSNRDGHWEIYVMNADGSDQLRLTRSPANNWSPSWSPDGKKILFSSFRDRNWEIYVMNSDGSNPTRLTDDPAADDMPVWSPDGRVIAFVSKRSGNNELYLMNPDGSAVTRLTQTTANNFAPAWSPDGRNLAFESNRDGNWEIYVMNGDGTAVKNLTNAPAADQAPAWSPDGQLIAFQSNREGASDIWVMKADGSDARNWTHGAGISQSPAWRPQPKK